MIQHTILFSQGPIDCLLTWLVDHQVTVTLFVLALLGLLLLVVAIRLFRQSASRSIPAKTRTPPAAMPSRQTMATRDNGWQLIDKTGQTIPLQPLPFTIGREGGNTLALDDPSVAPRHARVIHDSSWNGLVIEDLDSPSGIHVDDKPTCKNLLRPGMHIHIGRYIFTLNQKKP